MEARGREDTGGGMRIENGQWFWRDVEDLIMEKIGYCLMDNWTVDVYADQAEDGEGGWIYVDFIDVDPEGKIVYFEGIYHSVSGEEYPVEGYWDSTGYWEFDRAM